jgi:chemotaxis protein CheZ
MTGLARDIMAEPRKIFRIEETVIARRARPAPSVPDLPYHGEIMQSLVALQTLMAAAPALSAADTAAARPSAGPGHDASPQTEGMARIADELDAVTAGTAQATQKILAAAEEIDQLADNLSAALKGRLEQELAQDIADSVLRIFEACNFQDLISQRVGKVMNALAVKDVAPAANGAPDLHGPRLDRDKGHLSQSEIDAIFGA